MVVFCAWAGLGSVEELRLNSDVFLCQVDKGSIVLAGFLCQLDTGWSYHGERSFTWGSVSRRSICGAFSHLGIKRGGLLMSGTISGLVFCNFIREQAGGAMVAHSFNPSTWEAFAGRCLSLRAA